MEMEMKWSQLRRVTKRNKKKKNPHLKKTIKACIVISKTPREDVLKVTFPHCA